MTAWSQKETSSTDPEIYGLNITCKIYSVEQFSYYVSVNVHRYLCVHLVDRNKNVKKTFADWKFQGGVYLHVLLYLQRWLTDINIINAHIKKYSVTRSLLTLMYLFFFLSHLLLVSFFHSLNNRKVSLP